MATHTIHLGKAFCMPVVFKTVVFLFMALQANLVGDWYIFLPECGSWQLLHFTPR